ncbi:Uncharacterised protein [Bordetella pertussis]|nr:Uncharacterised protein [Bordetella pertussis]
MSSTWSNSGYPVVRSAPLECEPSAASRLTPLRSTPKLARKLPLPSITCRLVSYRLAVPGCLRLGLPQHGHGRPK